MPEPGDGDEDTVPGAAAHEPAREPVREPVREPAGESVREPAREPDDGWPRLEDVPLPIAPPPLPRAPQPLHPPLPLSAHLVPRDAVPDAVSDGAPSSRNRLIAMGAAAVAVLMVLAGISVVLLRGGDRAGGSASADQVVPTEVSPGPGSAGQSPPAGASGDGAATSSIPAAGVPRAVPGAGGGVQPGGAGQDQPSDSARPGSTGGSGGTTGGPGGTTGGTAPGDKAPGGTGPSGPVVQPDPEPDVAPITDPVVVDPPQAPPVATLNIYMPSPGASLTSDSRAPIRADNVAPGSGTVTSVTVRYSGGSTALNATGSYYYAMVTGLTNGRSYTFIARVCNSNGLCTDSNAVSFVPYDSPDAGTLTVAVSGTQVRLTWSAVTMNHYPRAITCTLFVEVSDSSPAGAVMPASRDVGLSAGSSTFTGTPGASYRGVKRCTDGRFSDVAVTGYVPVAG